MSCERLVSVPRTTDYSSLWTSNSNRNSEVVKMQWGSLYDNWNMSLFSLFFNKANLHADFFSACSWRCDQGLHISLGEKKCAYFNNDSNSRNLPSLLNMWSVLYTSSFEKGLSLLWPTHSENQKWLTSSMSALTGQLWERFSVGCWDSSAQEHLYSLRAMHHSQGW